MLPSSVSSAVAFRTTPSPPHPSFGCLPSCSGPPASTAKGCSICCWDFSFTASTAYSQNQVVAHSGTPLPFFFSSPISASPSPSSSSRPFLSGGGPIPPPPPYPLGPWRSHLHSGFPLPIHPRPPRSPAPVRHRR